MRLSFNREKLCNIKGNRNDATLYTTPFNYSISHMDTNGTGQVISENIQRIGGFDTEPVDKEILELMKKI